MANDAKEERQREILMAAMQAFAEQGYDKTSVEDIVRISGLSKGTLYWYFKNKEAILQGLMDMVFAEIWGLFESTFQATVNLTPPERLRRLLVGLEIVIDESINWTGLYADFFNQAWQNPPLRENFRRLYLHYVEAIEPIIQQGIDEGHFRAVETGLAARTLVGALDGYWFQQILELGDARPVLELYADLVIKGLMNNDAKSH